MRSLCGEEEEEESINCGTSGEVCGDIDCLSRLQVHRTDWCKYLFFSWKTWSAVKMECLIFLFVRAVGGVHQLHTEQGPALLSLLSALTLCPDWFYTSLPTWYVLHLQHPHQGFFWRRFYNNSYLITPPGWVFSLHWWAQSSEVKTPLI